MFSGPVGLRPQQHSDGYRGWSLRLTWRVIDVFQDIPMKPIYTSSDLKAIEGVEDEVGRVGSCMPGGAGVRVGAAGGDHSYVLLGQWFWNFRVAG